MAMISSRVLPALLPITANNMFLPLRIKLQPALLLGDVRRLHPVVRSQLLDGCREVVAHRSLGQRERVRNLRDSRAMRRGGQHLTLALGEGIGARRERLGGERGIHHMLRPSPAELPTQAAPLGYPSRDSPMRRSPSRAA